MEIFVLDRSGVRVLRLRGKLTVGGGAEDLYGAIRRDLDAGVSRLLLDLQEVTMLDSTGLGVLVACLTSAKGRGARMKLSRISPKVEDVMRITETAALFEIFHEQDEAVASFR